MGATGILIALVAIGIAMAGATLKGIDIGVEREGKRLAPEIAQLKTEKANAQSANAGFAINEAGYKEQIRACNQRVDAVKADGEIAAALGAKEKSDAEKRADLFKARLAQFSAGVGKSTPVDQQCEAVKKVILDAGTTMQAIDALGLGATVVTTPARQTITITPATPPPKSAIKTLPGAK